MGTTRTVVRSLAIATLLASLLAPSLPAAARAATTTSISLYSDPGDFIGQGKQRVFHPGNVSQIGAEMEGDSVLAWAVGGPFGEGYSFQFAAPDGEPLEPGSYVGAQRLPFADSDRPGMEVTGESRGCNQLVGSFEVRELDRDAQGNVQRLWVVFQQHCEGDPDAAWGEVRINAWVPGAQALTAPGSVRWTAVDAWQTPTEVPVAYRGGAAVQSVALTGANAGDFTLAPDACQGRSGPCEVRVGFRPQAAGVRGATVRFTDVGGGVHEAALEGFAHGGTTQADIEVLSGDLAGQPGNYAYRPADARFAGRTYDTETILFLSDENGDYFNGRFGAGGATPLTPGDYPAAVTDYGPGPWLRVFGTPTGCNRTGGEFTVHEISRMPDGGLRSFDVSFSHECYADHRPALQGRWRYRAGATVALAPWLTSGPRPTIDAPPPASGTTSAPPGSIAGTTNSGARPPATSRRPRPRLVFAACGSRHAGWSGSATRTCGNCSSVRCRPAPVCGCAAAGAAARSSVRAVPTRAGTANAGRRLAGVRLRPGTVLELRVTSAGAPAQLLRYAIRRGKRPKLTRLCLPPGARAPAAAPPDETPRPARFLPR